MGHPREDFCVKRRVDRAIADRPSLLVPIRLRAVIRVNFGAPRTVSHVGPVLLVETGSGLEQFLVDIQNEPMFDRVDLKGTPWNGKQLIAHAQEPAERKNRVSDAARLQVDHQMLDLSEIFFLKIYDLIAR